MSGGVANTHIDSDPLFTGTHDGPDGVAYLQDMGAMFKSLGVVAGLYLENVTQGTGAAVLHVTDDTVSDGDYKLPLTLPFTLTTSSWDNGDTYKIYKTGTKNSVISYEWTDVSKGWQAHPKDLVNGWFSEDADLDDHGQKDVFGPGQPE